MYLYTTKYIMTEENKNQKTNPYDLVDKESQNVENTKPEQKESGTFVKKIVKTIAKLAWLPDPETGATGNNDKPAEKQGEKNANQETTLEQDVVAQEEQQAKEEEKKKFNFDNIMSGVTWVLDKIEKKVEEKTWLDLDAPLKKREEKLKEKWTDNTQTEVSSETSKPEEKVEEKIEETTEENEVEKNNEEYLSK